jgi:hypothetical protein
MPTPASSHPVIDDPLLVAVGCRCGQVLSSSTRSGLAAQLAVHWRHDDWATDLATAQDVAVARRWVAMHAVDVSAAELDD